MNGLFCPSPRLLTLTLHADHDMLLALQLFIDTSGWAFTYPMCRLSGVRVACYVHYPTVSTDMLQRVRQRKSLYNNSAHISGSRPASWVKLLYYYIFAWFYSMAGACANVRPRLQMI